MILTLVMPPVLIIVYPIIAKNEERLIRKEYGATDDLESQKKLTFLPQDTNPSFHQTNSKERLDYD
jgi:hypothetical protein